ncbi:MAG TPA: hypothetical protein VNN73_23625 [Blastocatellia bacterium]|nr:hypothetical protein [Blastocatellia bacterium]
MEAKEMLNWLQSSGYGEQSGRITGIVACNIAALTYPARVKKSDIRPFTPDEAQRFLFAIKGYRLEALYSWEDISLDEASLKIRRPATSGLARPFANRPEDEHLQPGNSGNAK